MTIGSIRSVARSIRRETGPTSDPNRSNPASAGWRWRSLSSPSQLWERLVHRLRHGPAGLVALALIIGTGAGLGAIAFRYLILWATVLFTGSPDYSNVGPAAHPWLPALGSWFVILAPVAGFPLEHDLLVRHDLDDLDRKSAGEIGELPHDGGAGLQPALGTAGGEIFGQDGGIGDCLEHLGGRAGDAG